MSKAIASSLRWAVWKRDIGSKVAESACPICGETINVKNYDCGHVIAESKGGKTELDNLRVVCRTCNSSMGTMSMEAFKAKLSKGKKSVKAHAPLLEKVKIELLRQGYELCSKKYGFDVCATKESDWGLNQYLVVGFNAKDKVGASDVLGFVMKFSKFAKTRPEAVEGIIAYTGELPRDTAAALGSRSELHIKFKKY